MAIVRNGSIELKNKHESVKVECAAEYSAYPRRLPITSAAFWPRNIRCAVTNATTYLDTLAESKEIDTQLTVEFKSIVDKDLAGMVQNKFSRHVAFVVPVFRTPSWNGCLHVFISTGQLLGIYRPVFRAGKPGSGFSKMNSMTTWRRQLDRWSAVKRLSEYFYKTFGLLSHLKVAFILPTCVFLT